MKRIIAVTALLFLSPVVVNAAPNEQFLRSIEQRLKFWNVGAVDYDSLTIAQASALHLELSSAPPRFSAEALKFRHELLSILHWDGSESRYSAKRTD